MKNCKIIFKNTKIKVNNFQYNFIKKKIMIKKESDATCRNATMTDFTESLCVVDSSDTKS